MKDTNMATLELLPQDFYTGDYEFEYGLVVMSVGFINTFKQDATHVAGQALEMLRESPPAIDYIQTFVYNNNIKFWVMASCLREERDSNIITFLLEDEY